MKNTVALAWDDRIVISPHIGDMGSARSLDVFEQIVADLQALYQVRAEVILCDAHPGYATTRWAQRQALPVQRIFHHHAHAAVACPAATGDSPVLVFTWDGVGLGPDGTLWGGEALLGGPGPLAALRQPAALSPARRRARRARTLAQRGGRCAGRPACTGRACRTRPRCCMQPGRDALNTPQTSAAGRLFDAAAALTGLCTGRQLRGPGTDAAGSRL